MSEIVLVQFPGKWGLPNASPFCFKLEAWMSLQGIPFTIKSTLDPRSTPKGKLPVIVDGGRTIADSTHILEYLVEKTGKDPEAALTPRQRAESVAFQRLCDDHLYWVLIYGRWVDDAGWEHMKGSFAAMPPPARWIAPPLVRRKVRKQIEAHGMGRHSPEQIYRFGVVDLDALAARVEGDGFFHGETATTIDTVVLSTVASFLWGPDEHAAAVHARSLPGLDAYCRRVWTACFGDRQLPDRAR